MKTSLEISENLFAKVKELARKRGTSVRALVEEGLRYVLVKTKVDQAVQPKLLTFGGDGFAETFKSSGVSWDQVRDEIYRGHGS